jgi:hypothetical protein
LSSQNQRHLLLDEMQQLAKEGKTCASCSGVCCTFVANSMLVTANEASALIANLQQKNLLTPELKQNCQQTIERFALDRPIPGTGQRSLLRRRYTCPLFQHKNLGCPLDPEAKPFGCLAFNPRVAGETEGKSCSSDQKLLEATERLGEAADGSHHELHAEKKSIPHVILAFFAPKG